MRDGLFTELTGDTFETSKGKFEWRCTGRFAITYQPCLWKETFPLPGDTYVLPKEYAL